MGTLKTNEEIKKEISETMEELSWVVEGGDAHDLQDACDKAHACLADTLALIERLESDASFYKNISALMDKTNREALSLIDSLMESNLKRAEKIGQLQAEREMIRQAFCNYVPSEYRCDCCKHSYLNNPALTVCPYYVAGQCDGNSKWEYYGIQKEN